MNYLFMILKPAEPQRLDSPSHSASLRYSAPLVSPLHAPQAVAVQRGWYSRASFDREATPERTK